MIGVSRSDLDGLRDLASEALNRMAREKAEGKLGFLEIPYDDTVVRSIEKYRKSVADRFTAIAVIGIGGSALGAQALRNALSHLFSTSWTEETEEEN